MALTLDGEEKAVGSEEAEVVPWRGLAVKTGDCRGCAQEIIKQQLVKGLSCSTAVKGP